MKAQRTRSQERIVRTLKAINHAISAQELYIEMRNRSQNMGLATVYRSLEALKLQGAVQVRTLTTGESLYSLVDRDRHHPRMSRPRLRRQTRTVSPIQDLLSYARIFRIVRSLSTPGGNICINLTK
jgi:hypothetical protein